MTHIDRYETVDSYLSLYLDRYCTLPFTDENISLESRIACINKESFKMYESNIFLVYFPTLNSILFPQMFFNPTHLTLSVFHELSTLLWTHSMELLL